MIICQTNFVPPGIRALEIKRIVAYIEFFLGIFIFGIALFIWTRRAIGFVPGSLTRILVARPDIRAELEARKSRLHSTKVALLHSGRVAGYPLWTLNPLTLLAPIVRI